MPKTVSGKYVTTSLKEYQGKKGVLLKIENPDSRVNTTPFEALKEMHQALEDLQSDGSLAFIVFYGGEGKVHAGADLALFSGEIDGRLVRDYLLAGANLDLKIKELSRAKTTVSIMRGERYGGSVEWPLMAEYSVCSFDTAVQFPEVNIGIIPGWDGVLNVMLRSNKENALYMAATGNRINAGDMLASGLVSRICSNDCVMDAALEIAAAPHPKPVSGFRVLASREETARIVAERMSAGRYRDLADEISRKMGRGELSGDKGADNFAGSYVGKKLAEMGKPIAPLAADAVFKLVDEYADLVPGDIDLIRNMAYDEVEACFRLMNAADRKTGVHSALTKNPLEKIPIYAGK